MRSIGDPQIVELLQATRAALRRSTRAGLIDRPLLADGRAVTDYLAVHLAHETNEHVRILYLDTGRRLIRDELLTIGTPDESAFCIRTIVARALELGATRIIVAHNHPSGILAPSRADLLATRTLQTALESLGIVLVDHRIVCATGSISILTALRDYLGGRPEAGA